MFPSDPRWSASRAVIAASLAGGIVFVLGLAVGGVGVTAAPTAQSRAESIAAFRQVESVLKHPRCQNCHTIDDYPTQGDDLHPHHMRVRRGPEGKGIAAMHCTTCHGPANNSASGAPGSEDWHLAPLSMGWQGLSSEQLCRNLLDPSKNRGRTGEKVVDHLRTPLVEWAWAAGRDHRGRERSQPPLSHAEFVQAAERWVATGAACPEE
jgi:mono/diheme cytochrome c family protein